MNTYQLGCFLSLAETLNFARTAEQLNTSQPAISRQIRSLENDLGVKLFHRSTRSVALTEEGKLFLADAKSIVTVARGAKLRFEKKDGAASLPYTIGCSGLGQMLLLVPALKELRELYPALHPTLTELPLSRLLPKLDDGTVHLAMGAKMEEARIKNCSYRELRKTRLLCVYAPDHPLARQAGEEVSLEALRQYPSILYAPTDVPTSLSKRQQELIGARPAFDLFYCDSAEEAVTLAAAGVGIALIPALLLPALGMVRCKTVQNIPEISFGVYYKTGGLSPVSRALIRLLSIHLAEPAQPVKKTIE